MFTSNEFSVRFLSNVKRRIFCCRPELISRSLILLISLEIADPTGIFIDVLDLMRLIVFSFFRKKIHISSGLSSDD